MGSEEVESDIMDFHYTDDDLHMFTTSQKTIESQFDSLLLSRWDAAMSAGHFRYTLGAMKLRELPGKFKFILELNELRGYERRKPDNITSLSTDFDPNKFNFTKVKTQEIVFNLCNQDKRHPVMINVSPLERGHILIVPDIKDLLPQRLTHTAAQIGLHSILLSQHRGMVVGFNSLCALASVNHLHLHAWYTVCPLFTQTALVECIHGYMYKTVGLPVNAFVMQLHGDTIQHLVSMMVTITSHLQSTEIAHNLLMVRGTCFHDESQNGNTVRVYIWPRKSVIGVKNDLLVPFNVAVAELSGLIPFYIAEEFDSTTEEEVLERIQLQQLPAGQFEAIAQTLLSKHPKLFSK